MGDKDKTVHTLRQALSLNPSFMEARKLYLKNTGEEWSVPAKPPPEGTPPRPESMVDQD